MTGFWLSLLIGLGYVIAAAVVAVGLVALLVCVIWLPGLLLTSRGGAGRRARWPLAVAALFVVAILGRLLAGCAVSVAYVAEQRDPPPAEAEPTPAETDPQPADAP